MEWYESKCCTFWKYIKRAILWTFIRVVKIIVIMILLIPRLVLMLVEAVLVAGSLGLVSLFWREGGLCALCTLCTHIQPFIWCSHAVESCL